MVGTDGPESKNQDSGGTADGSPGAAEAATAPQGNEVAGASPGEETAATDATQAPAPAAPGAAAMAEPGGSGAAEGAGGNGSPEAAAQGAAPEPEPDWKEQFDKARNQLLRVAADFDNFKKRSRRDLQDAVHRARDEVLQELLPVIDNLERAIGHAETAKECVDADNLLEGVRMVMRAFETSMERFGVRSFASVGQPFDPNFHEAISQRETADHPPGTVVEEYRRGYVMGERLARPAMVVVAKAPSAAPQATAPEGVAPPGVTGGGDGAEGAAQGGEESSAALDSGGDTDPASVSAPKERS